jgi:hypothetical protein
VSRNFRWIAQTFREAAWAPVLVFCLFLVAARVFQLYLHYPWADVPTHFLGGSAMAFFFWRAVASARTIAGLATSLNPAALALGGTAGTAILWEVLEFLSDHFLGTRLQHGIGDTVADLVFGLAGGAAYLLLRRPLAPARTAP